MIELTRTNDPVFLSWLTMRLKAEDADTVILDMHITIVEGSIGAIQRRMMMADDDLVLAHLVLQ